MSTTTKSSSPLVGGNIINLVVPFGLILAAEAIKNQNKTLERKTKSSKAVAPKKGGSSHVAGCALCQMQGGGTSIKNQSFSARLKALLSSY